MFTRTEQDFAALALMGGSYHPAPDCDYCDLFNRANAITFVLIAPLKDGEGYLMKVVKDSQAQLEATYLVCRKPELRHRLRKTRF